MKKIVNLRQARKAKARSEKRKSGDENAALHGRSAAERKATSLEAAREARRLDGHLRDSKED